MSKNFSKRTEKIIGGISFSEQDVKIMALLVNGRSYKTTAAIMSVSVRFVERHIRSIMEKIGCNAKEQIASFVDTAGCREMINQVYEQVVNDVDENDEPLKKYQKTKVFCGVLFAVIMSGMVWYAFLGNAGQIKNNTSYILSDSYLERDSVVRKVKDVLSKQSDIRTAVIVGVGGGGKTTLARKILEMSDAVVSWDINAETDESILESFTELAEALSSTPEKKKKFESIRSITNFAERKKRLINFVSANLKQSRNWYLLFDNVDDFVTVKDYFPYNVAVWGKGTLLITTRNRNLSYASYIRNGAEIFVDTLTETEKYTLFCKILYGDANLSFEETKKVKNFLVRIPPMPLDVSAAAYYLKNTGASFEDYIRMTEKTMEDFEKIQSELSEGSMRYNKTRYGIVTSTLEEVIKQNPKFKELLLFICMLDSQNIPKQLLKNIQPSVVNSLIYRLRKQSLIVEDKDRFSIHRSTQNIGFAYLINSLSSEEKKILITELVASITPYEYIYSNFGDTASLIPHLKSFLSKLDSVSCDICGPRINLLLTLGDIYRSKEYQIVESLKYFIEALKVNENCSAPFGYLKKNDVALINLKIGNVYTLLSVNDKAWEYLTRSLNILIESENNIAIAKNYRLMGVINTRGDKFLEANACFEKALDALSLEKKDNLSAKITEARIFSDMAFNYFMSGINRGDALTAVRIIQKAIDLLESIQVVSHSKDAFKVSRELIWHKSRLSGIYNALGRYEDALTVIDEVEERAKGLSACDNSIHCSRGIALREKALSYLRLNKVKESYELFMQAKAVFSKAMVFDYLFRLKMHEAEALIRLNKLDDAFKVCEEIFAIKNRERNNYCDLFFYTCLYHAAVIKYKQGDIALSAKYFAEFFCSMRELCRKILPHVQYRKFLENNTFDPDCKDIKTYFENSIKVFEAIYWKGYEFTKYYVEENCKHLKNFAVARH